jgi:hypothetical protein
MRSLPLDNNKPWDPVRRGIEYNVPGSSGYIKFNVRTEALKRG